MKKNQTQQRNTLPPDPYNLNGDRACWAAAALGGFRLHTGTDVENAVSDLLADLMHWCCRSGQDFEAELQRARDHYDCETAG